MVAGGRDERLMLRYVIAVVVSLIGGVLIGRETCGTPVASVTMPIPAYAVQSHGFSPWQAHYGGISHFATGARVTMANDETVRATVIDLDPKALEQIRELVRKELARR